MAKKAKRPPPYCSTLEITQWHERDRNNVRVDASGGKTILDVWDEDVHQLIQDGFFKVKGPMGRGGVSEASVREYLQSMGACRPGTPQSIFGRARRKRR